jgi:uncharacterized membrane protein (UPF0127 family)
VIELRLPTGASLRCELADTFAKRFRGFMGRATPPLGEGMLFAPGGSIHTVLMRFRIDVAFVAGDGTVLRVAERVPSWRFRRAPRRTRFVVEIPSDGARVAFAPGGRLELVGREWPARGRLFGRRGGRA